MYNKLKNVNKGFLDKKNFVYILQLAVHTVQKNWISRRGRYLMIWGWSTTLHSSESSIGGYEACTLIGVQEGTTHGHKVSLLLFRTAVHFYLLHCTAIHNTQCTVLLLPLPLDGAVPEVLLWAHLCRLPSGE